MKPIRVALMRADYASINQLERRISLDMWKKVYHGVRSPFWRIVVDPMSNSVKRKIQELS